MKNLKTIRIVIGMVHRLCPSFLPILISQKLILTAIPYVNLVFSSRIIDDMLAHKSYEEIFPNVLWLLSLNCALNIIGWGLDKLSNIRRYVLADRVQKMISEKGLTLDYELLEKKETLEHIEKAREGMMSSGDIGHFCAGLANVIGYLVNVVYSTVLFAPIFVSTSTTGNTILHNIGSSLWSGSVILIVLILQVIVWIWAGKKASMLQKESFELNVEGNRRFGYFCSYMDAYDKGKDLRMSQLGKVIVNSFSESCDGVTKNFETNWKKTEKYAMLNHVCSGLFALTAYAYTGIKAVLGLVSVGNVTRYVGSFTMFSKALGNIVQTYTFVCIQAQYLSYFMDFMNIENQKYEGTLPIEKRDDNEYELEFRDVSFSYPNSEAPVIDHLSLKLKIGGKMAVVGPNGAGKTTFIKLLCRLYDPTEGQILLNGIDIRYYDYEEYIQLFSVVFQDFKLFSFSIAENVAVSKSYEEERVVSCLEKAGFLERLSSLEKGIETQLYQLEEDGVEISGGEAQKIAIARALYKDAPLVILDEPTSALDPISEYEIYKSFNELVEEKTAIYISHRMSSCRFCKQILVFDHGQIVQQGSHETLVEEGGLYREMWNSQAKYYQ